LVLTVTRNQTDQETRARDWKREITGGGIGERERDWRVRFLKGLFFVKV
jgi:hypothetical protein